jgi:hypothetical protein
VADRLVEVKLTDGNIFSRILLILIDCRNPVYSLKQIAILTRLSEFLADRRQTTRYRRIYLSISDVGDYSHWLATTMRLKSRRTPSWPKLVFQVQHHQLAGTVDTGLAVLADCVSGVFFFFFWLLLQTTGVAACLSRRGMAKYTTAACQVQYLLSIEASKLAVLLAH